MSRRAFLRAVAGGTAAAALGGCGLGRGRRASPRAIVLGIDGMDPRLARRFMDEGAMPNCRRLAERGAFLPLATSDPPQSPVAWSNFLSGTNPGGHGIFDFFAREAASLTPYLSTARSVPSRLRIPVGRYSIPLAASRLELLRKGPTVWDVLAEHGVEATAYKAPVCYPASGSRARLITDMGTPDIHGSYGIFSYYTDEPGVRTRAVSGGQIESIALRGGVAECRLRGPAEELLSDSADSHVPFSVERDARSRRVRIRIQGRTVILDVGGWSEWIPVRFPMRGPAGAVPGICRFYLKASEPHLGLYVTPVDIDPADPATPISSPASFSRQLTRQLGRFYTQGMPEDTAALSARVFTDDEFLAQAWMVVRERLRLLDYALEHHRDGFLFFYIGTLDMASHAFWRTWDPGHPLHTPELAKSHGDVMRMLYNHCDRALGRVLEAVDDRTLLFVMSDHGFVSFRRQFNLNSWLMDNGYAQAMDPKERGGAGFFEDVRWGGTRAYGLGINSLYLNVRGREPEGAVAAGEPFERLRSELIARLGDVRDPMTGDRVFARVVRPAEVYSGPYVSEAPDLVLCYAENYRASWETILGQYPREQFLDNLDPWSGDHCMSSEFLPGVCFCNRRLATERAALIDLAPTLLRHYGVPVPAEMTGRDLGPAAGGGAA